MTREKLYKKTLRKYEGKIDHAKRREAKAACQRCNEVKKLVSKHNKTLSAHAIVRAIRKVLDYKY